MHHPPRRSRLPPSDHHIDLASRFLAEMVLNSSATSSPRSRHPVTVGKQKVQSPVYTISPGRAKVKQEVRGNDFRPLSRPKVSPATKPVALSLVDFSYVLSLVFGGCCSNVYTYEYLLKLDPHLGTALTFSQMLFVTLHSLPSFLEWRQLNSTHMSVSVPTLKLKPRQVPLSQWALQVLVLTIGSLLNNWAFGFSVPLTVQIVFRSAGLAVSMLFGRLFLAKRYSYSQVASVLLVTAGVILATTSRPSSKSSASSHIDVSQYTIGVAMLTVSLLLTGVLGILQERTYTKYGPCWKEGVFYTHALSLPIFILFIPSVKRGFNSLNTASTIFTPEPTHSSPLDDTDNSLSSLLIEIFGIPATAELNYRPYITLLVNLITQLVCVSGVNQMTSRISSVSTNIVLTTRKAISLLFSVWWFGNGWNAQLGTGAGLVFLGSILYTAVTSRASAAKTPIVEEVKEVKVKVDEVKGDQREESEVEKSTLSTPGRVRKETRRLEREAVVKLEHHSPPETTSLTNRKWKGKGRMYQ